MVISFKPSFVRQFNNLDSRLQEETLEKIDLFKTNKNNSLLKIHKLHGQLKKRYSFSVNYKTRIVFSYLSKQEIVLLAIGDHDVYDV